MFGSMRRKSRFSLLCGWSMLAACAPNVDRGGEVIRIDCRDVRIVDLDNYTPILIQADHILGTIEHVCFLESVMLIHERGTLSGYDSETGEMLHLYSQKGRASDEYVSLWGFNTGNGRLYLQDFSGGKTLVYSPEGELCEVLSGGGDPKTFQAFAVQKDGRIIGKRSFQGMPTPELSLWDKDLHYMTDLTDELKIQSGIMLSYPFSYGPDGEILYIRYFRNQIYSVSNEGVRIKYEVDFCSRNFEVMKDGKDEYDALDHFNQSKGKASFISQVYEDEKTLSFSFIMSPEGAALAVYDKVEGASSVIRFVTRDEFGYAVSHMGVCYVFTQNEDGATFCYPIPLRDLRIT